MQEELGELLAAYAAGELDVEARAEVEARLARDPEARALLDRIQRVDAALAALPPVTPPPEVSAALHRRLQRELARTRHRRWRVLVWAGAAMGVAALASAGVLALLRTPQGGVETAAPPPAEGTAAPGEVRHSGRDYRPEDLPGLADDPAVEALLGGAVAAQAVPQPAQPPSTASPGEEGADVTTEALRDASAGLYDLADPVERCLADILRTATHPTELAFADVARFRGSDAIVYVLVSHPAPERARVEIWVVDRSTCDVLHLAQVER